MVKVSARDGLSASSCTGGGAALEEAVSYEVTQQVGQSLLPGLISGWTQLLL